MIMFTEENCKMVIDLMDNDEQKGMEMMMDLLISYQTKYEIKKEEIFDKYFRQDTKLIFQVLHTGLASDKMIKELNEEFTDSEVDKKDKEEYMNFTENIKFVLQKIDMVDLRNPDDEFSSNCSQAISFVNKKNEDMKGLSDTMKKLSFALEGLENALTNLPNDLNMPIATLVNPEDDDDSE